MPYTNDPSVGDFEKLQTAFRDLTTKFGSFEDVLQAFGLAKMPPAQRYGVLFGCIVFVLTISAVLMLLTLGGSFKRIAEQSATGEATLLSASEARQQRSLLLEQLLEGRERMVRRYPDPQVTEKPTALTTMLLNEAPDAAVEVDLDDENNDDSNTKRKQAAAVKARYIPPFYEANYIDAYRKCQDRPGGTLCCVVLSSYLAYDEP